MLKGGTNVKTNAGSWNFYSIITERVAWCTAEEDVVAEDGSAAEPGDHVGVGGEEAGIGGEGKAYRGENVDACCSLGKGMLGYYTF